MGLSSVFKVTKSPYQIECLINNSKFIFSGCDDVEKLKSLTNITTIWIEESTEITRLDFNQINLRMRGKHELYKQLILTFNPISTNSWLYDKWFSGTSTDYEKDSTNISKFTYHDNVKFLEQEYIDSLEAMMDTDYEMYKVYCLGEFGTLEGAIYRYFDTFQDLPTTGGIDETFYGLDFGYENPTALVRVDLIDGTYYVTELLYKKHLTNSDIMKHFIGLKVGKKNTIYCDAAEPQRIEEFNRAGYQAVGADKSVKDGILTVKDLHSNILLHNDSGNLNNEVINYRWELDRDGKPLDKPHKSDDHLLDAMRYALHTYKRTRVNYRPITFRY
jgi:phage terminase large subunit